MGAWKNSDQKGRWLATTPLDSEPRELTYGLVALNDDASPRSFDGVVSFDGHNTRAEGRDTIATRVGDADWDEDVYLGDFLRMVECYSGVGNMSGSGCMAFASYRDRDVAPSDLVAFQAAFVASTH